MLAGLIPSPWPVLHTARSVSTTIDGHGNEILVDATPVVRYVMSYFQVGTKGALSSKEVFSDEFLQENDTMLHMVVAAKELPFYKSGDRVVINGAVAADGTYTGGVAHMIDGVPASDLQGPWPHLYRHFGGYMKIVREG